jgi:hypothetical protein
LNVDDALGDADFESDGSIGFTGGQLAFGIAELIVETRLLKEVNNAISETITATIETSAESLLPGCFITTQYGSFQSN